MRSAVVLLTLMLCASAHSAVLSDMDRERLLDNVLKNFWGQAKLSNGQVARPASEAERNVAPVSRVMAFRAMDAGEVSGLGEWCKLDWESHYMALTRAARDRKLNDTQVAFVSFLHGAAQGSIASAMAKSSCTDDQRGKVQQMLEHSKRRGVEGT